MSAKAKLDGEETVRLDIAGSKRKVEYRQPTEEELKAYRPCRLLLVALFILLLIALLVAAVVLIAVTPKCDKRAVSIVKRGNIAYQVNVKSFFDSDNDGIGDLQGVAVKLDYLESLGITTLILADVIQNSNFDLDNDIGDLKALRELLELCKSKRISVVLEVNPVYTTAASPWFLSSRQGPQNEKRSWYLWQNSSSEAVRNNWDAKDGKSPWHADVYNPESQFYSYYGNLSPALNYQNAGVLSAVKEALKMWLDRGINGFLMTGVSRLTVDANFQNNTESTKFDQDLLTTHNVLRELYSHVHGAGGQLWLLPRTNLSESRKYYGLVGERESDVVPNDFLATAVSFPKAADLESNLQEYARQVPAYGSSAWVAGGMQYVRIGSRLSDKQADYLSLFLLVLPGRVFPYYGDELGMKSDGQRSSSIMQWDASVNAGFTKNSSGPYIPLSDDYKIRNVAALGKNNSFATLAQLRSQHALFHDAPGHVLTNGTVLMMIYGESLLVVANFGDADVRGVPTKNPLVSTGFGRVLFSTSPGQTGKTLDVTTLDVSAFQLLVVDVASKYS